MKKIIAIVVVVAVVAAGLWYVTTRTGENTRTEDVESVVAVVNGEEITRGDLSAVEAQIVASQGIDPSLLSASMRAQIESQAIETVVSQALLRQAAAEANVEVPEENVDIQIEAIKGQFDTEEAYQNALGSEGLTESELRSQIRTDLAVQSYLDAVLNLSAIEATEAEVEEAYNQVATGEGVPPLEEVYMQVESMVIQQKQQEVVGVHIDELRTTADIQILV